MPEREAMLLPGLARAAIAEGLGLPHTGMPVPPSLRAHGASFVTLHLNGALRGCIGSLIAVRPLDEDVGANAVAAAFHDPRFPPLPAQEFGGIDISVSVLAAPVAMPVDCEADAVRRLEPGRDGLILAYRGHRSTFLPQVWQQLPDAHDFLAGLKRKAGLSADFWHPDIRLSRYRVDAYSEREHGDG